MIHQYKQNGYNIVLDSLSGSVHAVDEVAYDIISMYADTPREVITEKIKEKYQISIPEIEQCIRDVDGLKEQKLLFCEDIYEDKADVLKNKNNAAKALCLHVAHTCNLN